MVDPADYAAILDEMRANNGALSVATNTRLARKAQELRYGENPHQQAALYGDFFRAVEQLHGKELSYNNLLDAFGTWDAASEFSEPAAAIFTTIARPTTSPR